MGQRDGEFLREPDTAAPPISKSSVAAINIIYATQFAIAIL
ncbi:hypothetical protein [Sphaerothrix gracilis]